MAPSPMHQLLEAAHQPPVLTPQHMATLVAKAAEGDQMPRLIVQQLHRDANTIYMFIQTLQKREQDVQQMQMEMAALRRECIRLRGIASNLADFIETSHANADEHVPDDLLMQIASITTTTEGAPCPS